ncbi:3-dehydroquinate synthase [Fulvivirga sp. 29W222]|uniref:3-dehydroquinate synthase n=1 Tax=Fulvivirga marina TaxID=2494733 RepID=A0A937FV17_9BACT|nr:3-dehydroquinate synthase [Fulvivirga marina]MBL6446469.1 3-dehydroquinate synthase [Fulvivirga marina]
MTIDNIIITGNVSEVLNDILNKENYSKIAVLVDENTLAHCYPLIKSNLPQHTLIQIKSGEINKTLNTCTHVWQELTDQSFDRKSLFINLGGGVIGDLGGFCAGTYKRGIDFINLPTTLLSQVDASVGGKLGIDFNGFKNHIGLFQEPKNVLIDLNFLKTLPEQELRSGFAEILKHHLIADRTGWEGLKHKTFEAMDWTTSVPHSVQIKHKIVTEDPHESGLRKALNFGHTIGHGIESYLLNSGRAILHGEAVAAGIICEAYLSYKRELITEEELNDITQFIQSIYEKINLSDLDREEVCNYLMQDKKNRDNNILAVLLNGIGSVVWDQSLDRQESLDSLVFYDKL